MEECSERSRCNEGNKKNNIGNYASEQKTPKMNPESITKSARTDSLFNIHKYTEGNNMEKQTYIDKSLSPSQIVCHIFYANCHLMCHIYCWHYTLYQVKRFDLPSI